MGKSVALSCNDIRNIIREPILMIMLILPLFISVGARLFIPWVAGKVNIYFEMTQYFPLISAYFIIFTPVLMGTVTGLLILDERDEGTIMNLFVTPLSQKGYVIHRIAVPTIISFIYSLLVLYIVDLIRISFVTVIPIAILSSLETPIIALFLATYAGNKVEGLALSKGLSLCMLAPLIEYFTNSIWRHIAGIIPFYWPVQAFTAGKYALSGYTFYILVGLLVHIVQINLLMRRFLRRVS